MARGGGRSSGGRSSGGKKSGIKLKKSTQGALRKTTKAKKGQKIPVATLKKLKKSPNPKTRQRANFALNARKWAKGGKKK